MHTICPIMGINYIISPTITLLAIRVQYVATNGSDIDKKVLIL